MEMHQVRYFLAACEELNFTRAANRCDVSQPSLTNGIKRLEQDLGGPLFSRGGRNVQLSALGHMVLPYLKQLDECTRDAKREAAAFTSLNLELKPQAATEVPMHISQYVIAIVAFAMLNLGFLANSTILTTGNSVVPPSASITIDDIQRSIDMAPLPQEEVKEPF
jgi:hypothetical protein